jgi:hypothetical protein
MLLGGVPIFACPHMENAGAVLDHRAHIREIVRSDGELTKRTLKVLEKGFKILGATRRGI